eukprot:437713-Rhodomonas_salina.2
MCLCCAARCLVVCVRQRVRHSHSVYPTCLTVADSLWCAVCCALTQRGGRPLVRILEFARDIVQVFPAKGVGAIPLVALCEVDREDQVAAASSDVRTERRIARTDVSRIAYLSNPSFLIADCTCAALLS